MRLPVYEETIARVTLYAEAQPPVSDAQGGGIVMICASDTSQLKVSDRILIDELGAIFVVEVETGVLAPKKLPEGVDSVSVNRELFQMVVGAALTADGVGSVTI